MDRKPVLLPVALPMLSDEAAAQLLDVLQELLTSFENHYYARITRHYQRTRENLHDRQGQLFNSTDPML